MLSTLAASQLLYIKPQIRTKFSIKNQPHKPKFSTNLGFSDILTYGIKGRILLTEHAFQYIPVTGMLE